MLQVQHNLLVRKHLILRIPDSNHFPMLWHSMGLWSSESDRIPAAAEGVENLHDRE